MGGGGRKFCFLVVDLLVFDKLSLIEEELWILFVIKIVFLFVNLFVFMESKGEFLFIVLVYLRWESYGGKDVLCV